MNTPRTHHPPTRPLNPPPPPTALTRHTPDASSTTLCGTSHDSVVLQRERHSGPPLHVLAACALVH
ncbi:hypothetical protein BU14_0637s0004 [Porphyra umbilicalis]|uniref:Uncharacterized protein n=1 Tax=Porphyra umbilicalis TaxID=2786 RepID=A0A1X6NQR5_PORUM|nr:hypothetical protein BU14_0637s0004 [Porphyra umbilicalis]|eukprot:OSX70912.1 hypothetical protein BU14_0637s0004 [Porphyra umbilicalis]